MDRETKKIITPGEKELVIKKFLTARERNELRNIYLSTMKIDQEGKVADGISGGVLEQAEHKLISIVVISYAGTNENILERLLDSSPEEYDFVVAEATNINGGNFPQAK